MKQPAGHLEAEVLSVLGASDAGMTPADVRAALSRDLAYTTVMTALVRLHQKGAVSRERTGRAFAYRPAADTATLTARRMRRLLDGDDDRAAVLTRFVAELSPADEVTLVGLLDEMSEGSS